VTCSIPGFDYHVTQVAWCDAQLLHDAAATLGPVRK